MLILFYKLQKKKRETFWNYSELLERRFHSDSKRPASQERASGGSPILPAIWAHRPPYMPERGELQVELERELLQEGEHRGQLQERQSEQGVQEERVEFGFGRHWNHFWKEIFGSQDHKIRKSFQWMGTAKLST